MEHNFVQCGYCETQTYVTNEQDTCPKCNVSGWLQNKELI